MMAVLISWYAVLLMMCLILNCVATVLKRATIKRGRLDTVRHGPGEDQYVDISSVGESAHHKYNKLININFIYNNIIHK